MTRSDSGKYVKKHPPDKMPLHGLLNSVKDRSSKGEIPCAVAFSIAREQGVPPKEVGFTIDYLELPIVKCQLGLFGYGPGKKAVKPVGAVSADLEHAIREALVKSKLPCASAWEIAKRLKVPKMTVSAACDALKIKISPCQIGVF